MELDKCSHNTVSAFNPLNLVNVFILHSLRPQCSPLTKWSMKLRETQIRLDFFALPILSCSRSLIPVHQCQYFCCWYKWLTILPRPYWLWSKENTKVFNLQNTKAPTLFIHVTLKDSTCYRCTIESIQSVCGSASHPGPLQVDRPEDPLWFHPPQPYTSQKHQQQQMEEEFLATSHHWAAEILDCLHQGWAAPGPVSCSF